MIAVDTNILVYAHREDSEFHRASLVALEVLAAQSGNWAIPWPCAHEFLSVVTGPAFGARRTPAEVAFETLQNWLTHPRCRMLAESEGHFALLEGLARRAALRGGALHDARIAAICIGHRVEELWTCDRDFDRFPDLRTRNPLVPSLHDPAPRSYA